MRVRTTSTWWERLPLLECGAASVTSDLSKLRVLVDCANGAATAEAPELFRLLGIQAFSVESSGAAPEREQVESLYKALTEAKQKSGEKVSGNLDSFAAFVSKKTSEIRKQHGCDKVVYTVEMQGGQVKLKAKAKS